jgi:tetratricopeptide (TPR) repeat protein
MTIFRIVIVSAIASFLLLSQSWADSIETCFKGYGNEAIHACTLLIKRQHKFNAVAGLYIRRGSLWMLKEQYEEAANDYTSATQIDASDVEAWIGLGRAYLQIGNDREAIANLSEALRLDPSNNEARLWIDIAYALRLRH